MAKHHRFHTLLMASCACAALSACGADDIASPGTGGNVIINPTPTPPGRHRVVNESRTVLDARRAQCASYTHSTFFLRERVEERASDSRRSHDVRRPKYLAPLPLPSRLTVDARFDRAI